MARPCWAVITAVFTGLAALAQTSQPAPKEVEISLKAGLTAATLKLLESVYKRGGQGIAGGELERMGTAQRGFLASAGNLVMVRPRGWMALPVP